MFVALRYCWRLSRDPSTIVPDAHSSFLMAFIRGVCLTSAHLLGEFILYIRSRIHELDCTIDKKEKMASLCD